MGEKLLLPHQQRVVDEANELNVKIKGLNTFIEENAAFDEQSDEERKAMLKQLQAMIVYSNCLNIRIALF